MELPYNLDCMMIKKFSRSVKTRINQKRQEDCKKLSKKSLFIFRNTMSHTSIEHISMAAKNIVL